MRYADLNPVRARMVRSPKDYDWSSYKHYAYGEPNDLIEDEPEYLALGRTSAKRPAWHISNSLPLRSRARCGCRRPDIVEGLFYGDPEWVARHTPRSIGPPS